MRCSPNYLLEEKVSGVPPVFQGREEFQPCPILVGTEMENGRRGEHTKRRKHEKEGNVTKTKLVNNTGQLRFGIGKKTCAERMNERSPQNDMEQAGGSFSVRCGAVRTIFWKRRCRGFPPVFQGSEYIYTKY